MLVALSIISITLNPVLYRLARPAAKLIGQDPVLRRLLEPAASAGRAERLEPTIVELNPKTVQLLSAQGVRAIYGDASHIETLRVAGLEKTKNLILTASELSGAVELIRAARPRRL